MNISSRTPEGTPNECPVCGHAVKMEPSRPFGDATCPSCGSLLWFVQFNSDTFLNEKNQDTNSIDLLKQVANQLGLSEDEFYQNGHFNEDWIKQFELDSLNLVELAMELEDEKS